MKKLSVVLLFALAACGVNKKDAGELLTGLEAIASAPADMHAPLLAAMCDEIPSCSAGACKEIYAAVKSAAPEDRMTLVAQCAPEVRDPAFKTHPDPFATWIHGRIDAYVKKARGALDEAEQTRLDAAWAKARPQ